MDPSSNFLSYRSTLRAAVSRSEGATDQRQRIVVPFFSLLVRNYYLSLINKIKIFIEDFLDVIKGFILFVVADKRSLLCERRLRLKAHQWSHQFFESNAGILNGR